MDFSLATSFPKKGTGGFLAEKVALNEAAAGPVGSLMDLMKSDSLSTFGNVRDYARAVAKQSFNQQSFDARMSDILERSQIEIPEFDTAFVGWGGKELNESIDGVFTKPGTGASGLPGSRGTGIKGLQQGFSDRFAQLAAAAREAGYSVSVGGGWRSYEDQVRLKKQKPRLAATPGRSNHGWGLAADLIYGNAAARNWVHQNAARFGLRFPMSYEPWHIEPMRIAGGSYSGTAGSRPTATPKKKRTTSAPKAPTRTTQYRQD